MAFLVANPAGYQPRDPESYMEFPPGSVDMGDYERLCRVNPPIGRLDNYVNIWSVDRCHELVDYFESAGKLRRIMIETGGGRNGIRFPRQEVFVSFQTQFGLSASPSDPRNKALSDIEQWFEARRATRTAAIETASAIEDPQERAEALQMANSMVAYDMPIVTSINASMSQLIYRHRTGRPVLTILELSHLAEAYHSSSVIAGWTRYARVEYALHESHHINESRKVCNNFGLMWRKPDGDLIPPEEKDTYAGPTLCWHAGMGSPCYGPYPEAWSEASGTPNPRTKSKGGESGGSTYFYHGGGSPPTDRGKGRRAARARGRGSGGGRLSVEPEPK